MALKNILFKALPLAILACEASCSGISYTPENKSPRDKYALLFSGQSEERDIRNMGFAYGLLLDSGFIQGNIYVLDENGRDREHYPVDAAATADNVGEAFRMLQETIDSNDTLFVYISDHGNRVETEEGEMLSAISTIDNSTLDQEAFAWLVSSLSYRQGIFIFDQCYSGGFAEELGHGNNVAIASTAAEERAFTVPYWNGLTFSTHIFAAYYQLPDSDANLDGRISIQEAFDYASAYFPIVAEGWQAPVLSTGQDASLIFLDE